MKLIILFLFSLLCSFQAYSTYILSPDINSSELKLAIRHFEEQKNDEILSLYIGELNRWAEKIELTNLELIIKTEFYKSFLNDSPQVEGVKLKPLKSAQLKVVELKLQTPGIGDFNQWFIKNLLEDYSSSTAKQKKYITPWLMRFSELSPALWNQLINKSIVNYFSNLAAHLQVINQFARTDRTATSQLEKKTLIDWEQDKPADTETTSKSEAIDLIDKNLPKAP